MTDRISRRQLLNRAGQAVAASATLGAIGPWAGGQVLGANERTGLAWIGCGRRGMQLLELALLREDVSFPVVCDVDSNRADAAARAIEQAGRPKPDTVADYQRVLERDDVQGVIIATPDHWHAIQLVSACEAEKDVYIETPVTHTVHEGIPVVRTVRKHHRVVQTGLQQRSGAWFEQAAQQIRSGEIGKVAQTRTWTFMKAEPILQQPDGDTPAHLDYDRWLGPAPGRPYNAGRIIDNAHNWWDYGGGTVTRWNTHLQDIVHWAMRVNAPTSVTAVGGNFGLHDFRETPDTLEVIFEYESKHPPVSGKFTQIYSLRMNNSHAGWGPPMPVPNGRSETGALMHYGTQFFGAKATLFVDRHRSAVLPVGNEQTKPLGEGHERSGPGPIDLLTSGHLDDFIVCMRTRNEPRAPIEAGHYAAMCCHLANVAYRVGRKLYFDARGLRCFTDAEHKIPDHGANDLLKRLYRAPYLPPSS